MFLSQFEVFGGRKIRGWHWMFRRAAGKRVFAVQADATPFVLECAIWDITGSNQAEDERWYCYLGSRDRQYSGIERGDFPSTRPTRTAAPVSGRCVPPFAPGRTQPAR